MSANPVTNEPVEVNGLPIAPAGGTVTSGTWAVSGSSYQSTTQARLRVPQAHANTPAAKGRRKRSGKASYDDEGFIGVDGFQNATTFTGSSLAVLANTNQGVILRDRAGVTSGLNNGIPIPLGGAVVDASQAKRVVVTLGYDTAFNAGSATVPDRFIPKDIREVIGKKTSFNTATWLSDGADQYTGTTAKDLAILGAGDDRAVTGRDNDTVVLNDTMNNKQINLGQGKDSVIVEDDALERGGQLLIDDFNSKDDKLYIDARKKDVKGLNSQQLIVSSGKKKTFIQSDGTTFSRSSVEFI
jgi:hypothetical protein